MVHTRRAFVVGLSAAAVVGGGCLQEATGDRPGGSGGNGNGEDGNGADGGEDGNGADDGNGIDATGNAEDGNDESTNEDGTGDDGKKAPMESVYVLQVERADLDTVAERFGVGRLADQPKAVRGAVRSAADGSYRIDSVDGALAAFVADHEYVLVDGSYYALDPTFPLEVLLAEPVDGNDVDGSAVADARDFRRDAVAADAVGEAVADGRAERVVYPTVLHDLVAEYDYVTPDDASDENADVYEWSLETDDRGGPPYRLEAEAVDEADVFGDDVLDLESLSSGAREEIRTAREEGRVSYDDSPAILDEGPPQFVRIDGTLYSVAVSVGN